MSATGGPSPPADIESEAQWIRVQRKTFARWCNTFLEKRGQKVESEKVFGLEHDMHDGIQLFNLLELISNEKLTPKPTLRPKMKLQKIENLNTCLRFVQSKAIPIVGIGAEDIHDGKTKLVLGLIWTLILRFQIVLGDEDSAAASAKKDLLDWCNRVLNPQGIKVSNFTSSWQTGVAFNGLVNALAPDTVPEAAKLPANTEGEKEKNLNDAFDLAQKNFGFAKLLDAVDVLSSPDELSIMTYVSYFREWLEKQQPNAANTIAEGPGLTAGVSGEETWFDVKAFNDANERVTVGGARLSAVLTGPGGESVNATIKDNLDGTYHCTYTVDAPGTWKLDVKIRNKDIKDSPFHPNIEPGSADARFTTAEGPGLKGAVAGDVARFKVFTKDQRGVPCKRGGEQITGTLTGPDSPPVYIKDNSDGTYDGEYVAPKTGAYQLAIKVGADNIKDSPFSVVIKAGSAAGGKSSATGEGLNTVVAGETGTFQVKTFDALGNPCETGAAAVKASAAGPDAAPVNIADNGDGTYAGSWTPTKTGDYKVDVAVAGEPVQGAPFAVQVVPAAADAAHTTASGPNLNKVVATEQGHFTVHTADRFGNPLTKGGDAVSAVVEGGASPVPVQIKDNGDGTYAATYGPLNAAGNYSLKVTLGGANIKDAPFALVASAGAADASASTATGEGLRRVVAGETGAFQVQSRDAQGNPRPEGGDSVKAKLAGPDGVSVDVKDNGDGTYDGAFVPTVAGDYTLDVQFNGSPVGGSPFKVEVVPAAADASHSEASGDGLTRAFALRAAPFHVQLKDRFGNVVPKGGNAVTATLVGGHVPPSDEDEAGQAGQDTVQGTVTDNGNGTYDGTYTLQYAGAYELAILLDGAPVKGSPFSPKVRPAPTDPKNTVLKGDGLKKALAGKPNAIRVQLRDANRNNRDEGGDNVQIKVRKPSEDDAIITDNGDGSFDVAFPAGARGKYDVDVSVDGQKVPRGNFSVDVEENPLEPELDNAVTTALPKSSASVKKALANMTPAERDAFLADIKALKS